MPACQSVFLSNRVKSFERVFFILSYLSRHQLMVNGFQICGLLPYSPWFPFHFQAEWMIFFFISGLL